jgi:hypothetical protein
LERTPDWAPLEVIEAGGTAVRFFEEQGGAEKIFDFAAMPVKPEVREWLVRVFARRIRPPAAVRRIKSADPAHRILGKFADVLADDPAVRGADGVTARHREAFRDQYAGIKSQLAVMRSPEVTDLRPGAGRPGGAGARLRGPSGADSRPSLATILQESRSTTTRGPTREVVSRV